jgi:DNA-binding transcriptional regulator YdaS (Cro superfamily)
LARELGISRQAVSAWRGVVPYKKARRVEAATRGEVSRFELRPDFYL